MQVNLTDNELEALLILKKMLKNAATPFPQFLNWVADRLVLQKGDDEYVDFIQTLRGRAGVMQQVSTLLGIERGPEHIP